MIGNSWVVGPVFPPPVPGVNDSLRAHDMSKSAGSTKTSHKQGIPWAQACNPRPVAGCRLVGGARGANGPITGLQVHAERKRRRARGELDKGLV
jgi:hypothetical protein